MKFSAILCSPRTNGDPLESTPRYLDLVEELARTIESLYPGWRMRIYHNVTSAQPAALASLCSLYCGHQHVDLCDTRRLPGLGDLNTQFPVGRFWRFQVRGHTCHVSRVTDRRLSAACAGARRRHGAQVRIPGRGQLAAAAGAGRRRGLGGARRAGI